MMPPPGYRPPFPPMRPPMHGGPPGMHPPGYPPRHPMMPTTDEYSAATHQEEVVRPPSPPPASAVSCPHKVDLVCGTCLSTGRKSTEDKKQSDRCTGKNELCSIFLIPPVSS